MYNTYVKVRILADFPDIVCSSGFLHHQCDVPNFDVGTLWFCRHLVVFACPMYQSCKIFVTIP